MGLLLKRDLKAVFRKKNTWLFFLSILLLSIAANLAMIVFRKWIYGTRDGTFSYNLIIFAEGFFWIPYYCSIIIADIAYGRGRPPVPDFHGAVAGYVASGSEGRDAGGSGPEGRDAGGSDPEPSPRITPAAIYFSKLLTSFILLVIFAAFAAAVFLLLTPLMQIHDGTIDRYIIMDFLESVLNALPLFLAGVSLSMMFLFGTGRRRNAYLLFGLFVILMPRLILYLASDRIRFLPCVFMTDYLITPQFQALQFFATRDVPKAFLTGLICTVLSTAAGICLYRRRLGRTEGVRPPGIGNR